MQRSLRARFLLPKEGRTTRAARKVATVVAGAAREVAAVARTALAKARAVITARKLAGDARLFAHGVALTHLLPEVAHLLLLFLPRRVLSHALGNVAAPS
nr:MAG: hypothetical protein [Molluscum contagiosum virus]